MKSKLQITNMEELIVQLEAERVELIKLINRPIADDGQTTFNMGWKAAVIVVCRLTAGRCFCGIHISEAMQRL